MLHLIDIKKHLEQLEAEEEFEKFLDKRPISESRVNQIDFRLNADDRPAFERQIEYLRGKGLVLPDDIADRAANAGDMFPDPKVKEYRKDLKEGRDPNRKKAMFEGMGK